MKLVSDIVSISNKRLPDESWEDYKERRKIVKKLEKRALAGFVNWSPVLPIGSTGKVAGPYVKDLHGEASIEKYLEDFEKLQQLSVENSDSQEEE